jgi:hypothetical protein
MIGVYGGERACYRGVFSATRWFEGITVDWVRAKAQGDEEEGGYGRDTIYDRGRRRCTDGACGKVIRVVVDPVARAVTHLVVEPAHRHGLGRLVPLGLVDVTTTAEARLRCTLAEFEKLGTAEDTHFAPQTSGFYQVRGYSPEQMLALPYYGRVVSERIPHTQKYGPTDTYDSLPWARLACAAASASMPPTATSG